METSWKQYGNNMETTWKEGTIFVGQWVFEKLIRSAFYHCLNQCIV
ncbi:MAG TPA: hypothetical protein PK990_04215 [Salinivirgaceae bacterium]|nr:hypothetical protein [Salinivirgaceae bacterium]